MGLLVGEGRRFAEQWKRVMERVMKRQQVVQEMMMMMTMMMIQRALVREMPVVTQLVLVLLMYSLTGTAPQAVSMVMKCGG